MNKLREQLYMILSEKIVSNKKGDLNPNTLLREDLGLDSLTLVDVLVSIEEQFDIEFDESDLDARNLIEVLDLEKTILKSMR